MIWPKISPNLSSARSLSCLFVSVGLLATMVSTGLLVVSILLTVAFNASVGRSLAMASTLDRTSLRAESMFVPISN